VGIGAEVTALPAPGPLGWKGLVISRPSVVQLQYLKVQWFLSDKGDG